MLAMGLPCDCYDTILRKRFATTLEHLLKLTFGVTLLVGRVDPGQKLLIESMSTAKDSLTPTVKVDGAQNSLKGICQD
jgi:hypothetical protein